MLCKNCGTQIADKALICYKCGSATTEAKYAPAEIGGARRGPSLVVVVLLLAVLLLAIFYYLRLAG